MDTSNKPKTVATIDINLHMPKVEKKMWLEECLADHFHCVLCGSELKFKHKTDFIAQTVVENAHCPSCQIRNRQGVFTLQ